MHSRPEVCLQPLLPGVEGGIGSEVEGEGVSPQGPCPVPELAAAGQSALGRAPLRSSAPDQLTRGVPSPGRPRGRWVLCGPAPEGARVPALAPGGGTLLPLRQTGP